MNELLQLIFFIWFVFGLCAAFVLFIEFILFTDFRKPKTKCAILWRSTVFIIGIMPALSLSFLKTTEIKRTALEVQYDPTVEAHVIDTHNNQIITFEEQFGKAYLGQSVYKVQEQTENYGFLLTIKNLPTYEISP